ncbi:hypothetical protein [Desulfurispira natronophila]|uniref:Uncharacterized protein n=1 Tax=Desulfurispira natronophila TaxID=682562 RepID=A0A7W8DGM8_9BACT|nr:hypothetical protein [Desulfurispira natronophila]MBB5021661.1 hypothetical protein [Desulfurispira natronophila]
MTSEMTTESTATTEEAHWGAFYFDVGQKRQWEFGAMHLEVTRQLYEWQVTYWHRFYQPLQKVPLRFDAQWQSKVQTQRHLFSQTSSQVNLVPCLPDRSVVIRPVTPCTIHSGEGITLYIGSPIWLQLHLNGNSKGSQDIPAHPLSDTWFGPDTRNGELCYLVRTRARTEATALQEADSSRVITPVRIENMAEKELTFDRFCIPLPMASLYQDNSGSLFSQQIQLIRYDDDQMAQVKVVAGAPAVGADSLSLVNGPRKSNDKPVLLRAFSAIFR